MNRMYVVLITLFPILSASSQEAMRFQMDGGAVDIHISGQKFGEFVFEDEEIPRSYFAHITTPSGIQVTRNHPPVKGQDKDDHAAYHPGIWMSFGDISGHDYWRNKAVTKHIGFLQQPRVMEGKGEFAVIEHHLAEDSEEVICVAEHQFTFDPIESGTLLVWDARFTAREEGFVFGDQEEMGLGVRVATSIMVENGGEILNSDGIKNEDGVWGKQADWAVYHGEKEGKHTGIMIMPSPDNFRRSWFHARDYGLLLANPFGRNAFTGGAKSQIEVQPNERFNLQFGVFIFEGDIDYQEIYQGYVDGYTK